MAGTHLRAPQRRFDRRIAVVVVVALLVGMILGATVTWLFFDDDSDVAAASAPATSAPAVDAPASDAPVAPGTVAGEPAPVEEEPPAPITLAFVGDIHAERSLATRLAETPNDFIGPFADLLRGADLAVGNLEAAVATGGSPVDKQFTFRAPPAIVDALRAGGLDVVSAANNHGMDHGTAGLEETLAVKRAQAGGMLIGVGGDEDEAFAPYIAEVSGHRVAVIGATQVLDSSLIGSWTATAGQAGLASAKRVDRLVEEVRAARAHADTVVVYLHWGVESQVCPSADQQTLARTLVDAGADVIVGGHAHRVQSGGFLGRSFVGYGLGNFVFGTSSAASASTGVLLIEIQGRDVLGYEWRPGRIVDRVPQPLSGDAASSAVAEWDRLRDCTGLTG